MDQDPVDVDIETLALQQKTQDEAEEREVETMARYRRAITNEFKSSVKPTLLGYLALTLPENIGVCRALSQGNVDEYGLQKAIEIAESSFFSKESEEDTKWERFWKESEPKSKYFKYASPGRLLETIRKTRNKNREKMPSIADPSALVGGQKKLSKKPKTLKRRKKRSSSI